MPPKKRRRPRKFPSDDESSENEISPYFSPAETTPSRSAKRRANDRLRTTPNEAKDTKSPYFEMNELNLSEESSSDEELPPKETTPRQITRSPTKRPETKIAKKEEQRSELKAKASPSKKRRGRPRKNDASSRTNPKESAEESRTERRQAGIEEKEQQPSEPDAKAKKKERGRPRTSTKTKAEASPEKSSPMVSQRSRSGRGKERRGPVIPKKAASSKEQRVVDTSSESEMEWEEVDGDVVAERAAAEPAETIEITLAGSKAKSEGKSDMEKAFEKFHRDLQENKHKVELLCLVAALRHRNHLCNDELLQAVCWSLLPPKYTELDPKSISVALIKELVSWFKLNVSLISSEVDFSNGHIENMVKQLNERCLSCQIYVVMVFLALLRAMGLTCRLVSSLQPVSFKWSPPKGKKKKEDSVQPALTFSINQKQARTKQKSRMSSGTKKTSSREKNNRKGMQKTNSSRAKKWKEKGKGKSKLNHDDDDDDFLDDDYLPTVQSSGSSDSSSEEEGDKEEEIEEEEIEEEAIEEEVIEEETVEKKSRDNLKKDQRPISSKGRRASRQSVDTSPNVQAKRRQKSTTKKGEKPIDDWIEVYLDAEKRWICISPFDCIDDVELIEERATQPISYVLGADNGGAVKDLTLRYASDWMSGAKKRRVNEEWWQESLRLFVTTDRKGDEEEDKQLQAWLEKQPFPTTVAGFKNHPLYALERHLLKFEALYPEDAPVLGYIRKEAIYPRDCVKVLHSRETWLKEAKAVKAGETPYKMVKKHPKKNESEHLKNQLRLELYGDWQIEDYVAPPAKDGKVPRNAFGNVELYKPSMLPAGTVHMTLPNIQKVARKLGIDCAAAMMGWDFLGGFNVPVFDGIVVCSEFEQVLIEAWEQQREEMEKQIAVKREKVVYERWKKLIKTLLIRERLRTKYQEFAEPTEKEEAGRIREWGQIAGVKEHSIGTLELSN
ncbi:DNA repair protein complementing XP-C cells homolog [Oscarella lobularis]|uniref:DNA repair protein complementing XP-C cells homolog n=1 Tax=Oscarella lobularis TaxID=121494 RepID=UPI0033140383